jgi:hypothetical protein
MVGLLVLVFNFISGRLVLKRVLEDKVHDSFNQSSTLLATLDEQVFNTSHQVD